MNFERLIDLTQHAPCWRPKDLCLTTKDMHGLRVQLNRWNQAGKVLQIKRGLYTLSDRYRKTPPPGWRDIFDKLRPGARVGGMAALSFFGTIPEQVFQGIAYLPPNIRPSRIQYVVGRQSGQINYKSHPPFPDFGVIYEKPMMNASSAFLTADIERAMLDVALDEKHCADPDWVCSMRFHYDDIDMSKLAQYAERTGIPRLRSFAHTVSSLATVEDWIELQ